MYSVYKVYFIHQSKLTILLKVFEFIRSMIHFCTKVVDGYSNRVLCVFCVQSIVINHTSVEVNNIVKII